MLGLPVADGHLVAEAQWLAVGETLLDPDAERHSDAVGQADALREGETDAELHPDGEADKDCEGLAVKEAVPHPLAVKQAVGEKVPLPLAHMCVARSDTSILA